MRAKACFAIEAFCEHLGEDIRQYTEPLVYQLGLMLQHSERHTRERCVSALGSVATAAGADFMPYFEPVYGLVRVILVQTNSADMMLRARATECVGAMALAVGRERCPDNLLRECISLAIQGLELNVATLREYTFAFFGQLAELMGAELAPLLPPLLAQLLTTLEMDELEETDKAGRRDSLGLGGGDGCDDDDDDDDDGTPLTIKSSLIEEKVAALSCIDSCAEHLAAAFAPHIGAVSSPLLEAQDHFLEDVRGAACRALASVVGACAEAERVTPWTKGEAPDASRLQPRTRELVERVWWPTVDRFAQDDDKDTVAAASEALSQILLKLGPHALAVAETGVRGGGDSVGTLVDASLELLNHQHACQTGSDDDDSGAAAADGADDDEDDHDEALWEAVSEMLTTLPKVLGRPVRPTG